ncbi:hypothetical protein [Pandoraea apista]|uniref:hypothetical protein n=1 Tax=Pandoraea apista TaxID=93218 RepID=UPI00069F1CE1|nr:hypothetical protein [Pandoraea apista]
MKTLYARVQPKQGVDRFFRCGIAFGKDWKLLEGVDDATAKRLEAEQMLEVSEQRPAELGEQPGNRPQTSAQAGEQISTASDAGSNAAAPAPAPARAPAANGGADQLQAASQSATGEQSSAVVDAGGSETAEAQKVSAESPQSTAPAKSADKASKKAGK